MAVYLLHFLALMLLSFSSHNHLHLCDSVKAKHLFCGSFLLDNYKKRNWTQIHSYSYPFYSERSSKMNAFMNLSDPKIDLFSRRRGSKSRDKQKEDIFNVCVKFEVLLSFFFPKWLITLHTATHSIWCTECTSSLALYTHNGDNYTIRHTLCVVYLKQLGAITSDLC